MALLAGVCLAALALVSVSALPPGRYCTVRRLQRYSIVITYWNPCPYRGNYISRRLVWRTRFVNQRVCCAGWTGCYCHIPICNNCGLNQKCVAPNICDCVSKRYVPVAGNNQCSLDACTTETNCYPGVCQFSGQCACSSGFEGNNCQTVSDTARYRKCEVTLVGTDHKGDLVNDTIDGQCSVDEIIRDVSVKSLYSKVNSVRSLKLNWEGYYDEPRDLPKYAPYIAYSLPGIVYASTDISGPGGLRKFPCYDGSRDNRARLTTMCTESQPWRTSIPHESKYNISLYTLIGGYKEFKAVDNAGEYAKQIYSGLPANLVLDVTFDSEAPVHCMENQRYQCMSQGDIPDPEPIFAGIDATTEPDITFYWAGWYDEPSQIAQYAYSIWELQYVNGKLVPYGPPTNRGVWEPNTPYPEFKANKPSLISAVLNVTDNAGNMRRADTLVLFAPNSSMEADPTNPIKVQEAPDGGRWVNTLTVPEVTLRWSGHFINEVFQKHKLLSPVVQHPDIDYPDKYGNITAQGLAPTEGIKNINFTYLISSPNGRLRRQARFAASVASLTDLRDKQVVAPFNPSDDGDTLTIDLTVEDVMGNVVKETVLVGADSSAPIVDQTSGRFEENTNKKIDGLDHFTSSFLAGASDPHSGVTRADWVASQPGKNVSGSSTIPPVDSSQCLNLGQNCICTPLGECYDATAEVLIDNCVLANLNKNLAFNLEVTFLNNASLAASKVTRKINPFKISGPGEYPHVPRVEPILDRSKPTEAEVRWQLPHACETLARIRVEYSQTNTGTKSLILPREAVNISLTGLHAQRDSTVAVILVYADGTEAPNSGTFITPATALKITGGQIAGAVIGLIVLVFILLILLLLLLMWLYRKRTIEEKPKFLVAVEDKMETYGVLKVYRERIYQDSPYYTKQTNLKTTGDDIYDEVKEYQKMDLPRADNTGLSKYDISTIVLGSGKLCIVKRANLRDSGGSKAVAAKMLKTGKGQDGKMLLEAKINYLARIPKHENLVNYVYADMEVPVLFLELCGLGTLLDWVKARNKLSTEDNDQLLGFSQDMTAGLKHLHDNNIIHRRMAAHNVLLANGTDRPIAKITGFGPLASDHNQGDKKIPARWMAPEIMGNPENGQQRPYTTHSDMWSWGVTIWEMFSLGQKPYAHIPIEHLKKRIIQGERLAQPQYCADTVYESLMKPCWKLNPTDRATADHVYQRLDTFLNGGHTNSGYYGNEVTQDDDDDHMLENEQNRERIYSNNPNQNQPYDDPSPRRW